MFDFCQACRHYDIVGNKCSKAPKRAIPKRACADYEFHTHKDLCKYCSHNDYGRCTVLGHKCSVEPLLMNICAVFENKKVMEEKMEYKRKEWLCARCANSCKWDCEMDYCDKFVDKVEADRIANANQIAAIRKRCEEFMQGLERDFGYMIVEDTACIKETEQKNADFNRVKNIAYVEKLPWVDFNLAFTVYKKD